MVKIRLESVFTDTFNHISLSEENIKSTNTVEFSQGITRSTQSIYNNSLDMICKMIKK